MIEELFVYVGDEVKAGDVLARLYDTDAQQAIADAELQLIQESMQMDGNATLTGVSYNDIAIEQAQINLELAQAYLEQLLNWQPNEDEIAQAEANLDSAQATYQAALGQESASANSITVSSINLESAQRSMAEAQAAYDLAFDPAREWELNDPRLGPQLAAERDKATRILQAAQDSLAIAQAQYNASVTSTNSSNSTSAQSNILAAQLALQAVQVGPSAEEIAAAETAIRQAELALQQVLLNQEAGSILLSRTSALNNVMIPLIYKRDEKLSHTQRTERAMTALESVGLADRA